MEWVNIIIQGVLIGGLYAMFAAGLALIFGVMRLVNIAHGDLIVLAAYIALMTTDTLGLNPLLAIIIVVPIMAAIGYGLQRALLNRTLGDDVLPPLLVTFGLSVIIQNALLEVFTPTAAGSAPARSRSRAFRWWKACGSVCFLCCNSSSPLSSSARCNSCSTARRSAALFAQRRTIRRWRN